MFLAHGTENGENSDNGRNGESGENSDNGEFLAQVQRTAQMA